MKTIEYLAVTALSLAFAAWVATTAIHAVEQSITHSAQMIAKARVQ